MLGGIPLDGRIGARSSGSNRQRKILIMSHLLKKGYLVHTKSPY